VSQNHDGDGDDELLRALGARGRAQREDLSELERLATPPAGAADASPVAAAGGRAHEVFAPFDAATRARFVDGIMRSAGRSPSEDAAGRVGAGATVSVLSAHRPLGTRRRTVIAAAGVALAAAAAVVLVVGSPAPEPRYALEIRGGDERQRAGDPHAPEGQTPVLTATSWLEIRARPARPTRGTTAWAFVRAAGGVAERLATAPEISADGVVRWRGTAAALLGNRRGDIELRVVVGAGPPPAVAEVFSGDRPPRAGQSWLVGRVQVRP
jgi:hypothetical protein